MYKKNGFHDLAHTNYLDQKGGYLSVSKPVSKDWNLPVPLQTYKEEWKAPKVMINRE